MIKITVNLIKFVDVLRLWQFYSDRLRSGNVREVLYSHDIAKPVAWVLEHLDNIFESNVVESLNLSEVITPDFLYSTRGAGGTLNRWGGSMREQLQNKQTERLGTTESSQCPFDKV